jgi:TolB protein
MDMRKLRPRALVAAVVVLAGWMTVGAVPASATFPGQTNGRIAFDSYISGQIYAVNPDGSALRQLTHFGPNSFAAWPNWSPHGARLLFSVGGPDGGARIWIMNPDGTHQHPLINDAEGFRDFTPKFTPDAKQIVFSRCQPDDGVCAIWKVRISNSHKQPLTPYVVGRQETIDFNPSVSPDGSRIAFTRFGANGIASQIYIMGADGSHPHAISAPRFEAFGPDWSPNGQRITFSSNSQHVGSSIFTMRPNGSDVRRLTPDRYPHNDAGSVYSPLGNRLVFSSDRHYPDDCCTDLFGINPDGSGEHMIDTGLSGEGIVDPAWGPAPLIP